MQSGTPLQSTAGAIQHTQSVIDYISKAVRHGQEIDQSFPVPNDVDIVQKICVEPVSHPDLQVAEGHQAVCRGGDTANNTSYKDKTCLSVSAKYNLALINQNLKHFVQTTNLQCFELPNFLNKGQKQKVSSTHARKCFCSVLCHLQLAQLNTSSTLPSHCKTHCAVRSKIWHISTVLKQGTAADADSHYSRQTMLSFLTVLLSPRCVLQLIYCRQHTLFMCNMVLLL